jgi:hypothetical protein
VQVNFHAPKIFPHATSQLTLDNQESLLVDFLANLTSHVTGDYIKVIVSIPEFDLFPSSRITPKSRFHLTYSCTNLELFPRRQSMQVYDLAKNEWLLFTERKWVGFIHGNSDLQ